MSKSLKLENLKPGLLRSRFYNYMVDNGLLLADMAASINLKHNHLSALLRGKFYISPRTAVNIERAFDGALGTATEWLYEQVDDELRHYLRFENIS